MAIQEYIENTSVFTRAELLASEGDTRTNVNLLSKALRSGKVASPVRGVYVSNTGRFRANETDPVLIASKMGKGAIMAYQTALSLIAGSHDVLSRVSLYTDGTPSAIDFQGVEYASFRKPQGLAAVKRSVSGMPVECTSKEQTLVDCLANPLRAGGLELILRSLSAIQYVDEEKLLEIAEGSSKSVLARLGWLLSEKSEDWQMNEDTLNVLRSRLGDGPYYFYPTHEKGSWIKDWRIYLPADSDEVSTWLQG